MFKLWSHINRYSLRQSCHSLLPQPMFLWLCYFFTTLRVGQFTPLYRHVYWSAMHRAFDVSIVAQHFYFYQQEMYVPKFPIFFWDKKFDVNLYALLLLFVTSNWRCSHQICIWPNAAWVMYYFAGLHWSCVQFFVVRIFVVYMLFVRFYDL